MAVNRKWWQIDYDPNSMRNVQRLLFADGPSAVTTIPAGISDSSGGAPAPAKAAKTAGKEKAAPTAADSSYCGDDDSGEGCKEGGGKEGCEEEGCTEENCCQENSDEEEGRSKEGSQEDCGKEEKSCAEESRCKENRSQKEGRSKEGSQESREEDAAVATID